MKLSVVIPTRNRAGILMQTLKAFESQTLPAEDFDIIVVSDGSSDNTAEAVNSLLTKTALNIRFFERPNLGVSAARNFGIAMARADIILLMNDDVMPADTRCLELHLKNVTPESACLGHIDWHPELQPTEVMGYLGKNGVIFNFGNIADNENCGWIFFYSTNLSIHRRWFDLELFDVQQPFGNEDIELGYRLEKRGLRIKYRPEIRAFHNHYYADFDHYIKSKLKRKASHDYLMRKHPELRRLILKRVVCRALCGAFRAGYALTGSKFLRNYWWKAEIERSLS